MSSRRYLPPRAYGLVGDGRRTAALVARDGSVDWWPLPRLGDATVFARLLDDRIGGFCSAAPAGAIHDSPLWESSQRYLPGTNVLVTEFRGADAALRVTDFMPPASRGGATGAAGGAGDGGPPGEGTPATGPALLRRVSVRGGPVEAEVRFAPRFDYARRRPAFREREGGWEAVPSGRVPAGPENAGRRPDAGLSLAAGPDVPLERDGRRDEVSGRFRVEPGEARWLSLRWSTAGEVRPVRAGRCEDRMERAVAFWRDRAAERAPWAPEPAAGNGEDAAAGGERRAPRAGGGDRLAEATRRSALLLELLAVGPSGAVSAAATTSLPGAGPVRDARRLYLPREAAGRGGDERPSSGADPGPAGEAADDADPDRRAEPVTLDHLHGHRGERPVVVGGAAECVGRATTGARSGDAGPGDDPPGAGPAGNGTRPVRLAGELRRAEELAREGRSGEARRRIADVLDLAGPTGGLAETTDPGSGRMLGDFPWAPAHAALLRAARALAGAPE